MVPQHVHVGQWLTTPKRKSLLILVARITQVTSGTTSPRLPRQELEGQQVKLIRAGLQQVARTPGHQQPPGLPGRPARDQGLPRLAWYVVFGWRLFREGRRAQRPGTAATPR